MYLCWPKRVRGDAANELGWDPDEIALFETVHSEKVLIFRNDIEFDELLSEK